MTAYNPTAAWDRSELARLRAQVADLTDQLTLVRDTLQRRTDAMHRVAQENDQLRSRLANQETPRD